jgi:hypothetical protein
MKKTNLQSGLLNAQVNVNFDVITNVKIDKGGGGQTRIISVKIIVTIILLGFFLVPFLVLLLLSFWLL